MSPTFIRRTFEEEVTFLEKAAEWLNRKGIKTSKTRFEELIEVNKKIVNALKHGTIEELINDYGNLVLWQALIDADSFIKIYKSLHDEKDHLLPRKHLRTILEGPILPWEENPQSDNIKSRNILFELETAAVLKKADMQIIGFDDVDFIFEDVRFNVQCKRIHSPKKIKDNVDEAVKQLTKRMENSRVKGILCLSIDKLTGKENMILKVKTFDEIEPAVVSILNRFILANRHLWTNLLNIDIIGVLVSCKIVSWIRKGQGNVLTPCTQLMMDILASNSIIQGRDHRLIMELSKRLLGKFDN